MDPRRFELPTPTMRMWCAPSCATGPNIMLKAQKHRTFCAFVKIWWRRWGSNPRPLECHSSTLPAELRPHNDNYFITAKEYSQVLFTKITRRLTGIEPILRKFRSKSIKYSISILFLAKNVLYSILEN